MSDVTISKDIEKFSSLSQICAPSWTKTLSKVLVYLFVFACTLLSLTPWQQTSHGEGRVIALDPNHRIQEINANIGGIVSHWLIKDGDLVEEGQPIVELLDNDPDFVTRLQTERDAAQAKLEASQSAADTALINYGRQQELYEQGLSPRTKFEKAQIEYQKLISDLASAKAGLAKAEVKLSRQRTQTILAPRKGRILRILKGSGSVLVKKGDPLVTFVPSDFAPAVELFVNGNDMPLIRTGRKVRLQFEGWPAFQFSGWPSASVGTFGGIVKIVDPSVSPSGLFRVLIVPEDENDWPSFYGLRQGNRVYGWVLLNEVKLGYELWRLFNGFPPSLITEGEENKEKKKKK